MKLFLYLVNASMKDSFESIFLALQSKVVFFSPSKHITTLFASFRVRADEGLEKVDIVRCMFTV